MSNRSFRRRLNLLAGVSIATAFLTLGGAAQAETCPGNYCSGTYTEITYPNVDYLFIQAAHDLNVTTGGVYVSSSSGAYTGFYSAYGSGQPGITITNTSGAGIDFDNPIGTIDIGLYRDDPSNGPLTITGATDGVRLIGGPQYNWFWTTGDANDSQWNGTIAGQNGAGINAAFDGYMGMQLASTITGTTAAISTSGAGTLDLVNAPAGILQGDLLFNNTGGVSFSNRGTWIGKQMVVTGPGSLWAENREGQSMTGNLVFNNTGGVDFENTGTWSGDSITATGSGSVTISNIGSANSSLAGAMSGNLVLHNTGGVSFTNGGKFWRTWGANVLGDGNQDTFTNEAPLILGRQTEGATTVSLSGAETWTNKAPIIFGANADLTGTDGVANDRLVLSTPTNFIAVPGSQLWVDVAFSGVGQSDCSAAVDADCLDMRGSTVTGVTDIVVNNLGGAGSLKPIVLVDVGGGTSDASSFTLSSSSSSYATIGSGVLQTPLFDYELAYDAAKGQYALQPHPNAVLHGLSGASVMADSIWEATTGYWQNRQADLRGSVSDLDEGAHPGFWLKALQNKVDRTGVATVAMAGLPAQYDIGFGQKTNGALGGLDLLDVQGDGYAWVAGLTAGHVTSDVDFKTTAVKTRFEGNIYGAYGSFLAGPLFVDGIVNVNDLDATYGVAGLTLKHKAKTTGVQLEGGYRIAVNEGAAWLEPIATLAYAKRNLGSLQFSDALSGDLGDATVFKGALGVRLGGKMDLSAATVGLALTARAWDEFKGDHALVLNEGTQTLTVADEKPGTTGDVGVTLNVMSRSGRLSGFADYGFKFRQGYSDSTASLGVRVNF